MAEPEISAFPLAAFQPAANAHHDWTAILLRLRSADGAVQGAGLADAFATSDLLSAIAPIDLVLMLDSPALDPARLPGLPAARVILAFPAACLRDATLIRAALALQTAGYRILIDGPVPAGVTVPATLRGISARAGEHPSQVPALFAPHLVRGVDSYAAWNTCKSAGFTWFSGAYMAERQAGSDAQQDAITRKRLLALLGLLARDADSRELENQLKQDPALSYHLLKLANSAAFAVSTPIHSFGQAINVLGRRQLQRWLQLLLYARQQHDAPHNPMLPIAALRAATLETLCRQQGGDREAQDLAFMTGVFSLLDQLFGMPMSEIVGSVGLPDEAAGALLARSGQLGRWLALTESEPTLQDLEAAGISTCQWWDSQLHALHWALQVSRNL